MPTRKVSWIKKSMVVLGSIVVCVLFLSLWGFYSALHPVKIVSQLTPKHFDVHYENVSFQTQDGVLIRGWFIPTAKPKAKTIILLHGYPADKGDILSSKIFLHKDYNLLFFDFRSLGESEGRYSTAGKEEILDLLAAINYLNSRGIHQVGVWGLSMGGAVALMTAPQAPQIKAIIAESAYARLDWMATEYYRLPLLNYALAELTRLWTWLFLHFDINDVSPAKSAEQLTIPILLIHSKKDHVVSFRHGLLFQQSLQHNPSVQFIFVDQALHGQPIDNDQQIVKQFFDANMR